MKEFNYDIKCNTPFNINNDDLFDFYLPIIGNDSYIVYNALKQQKDSNELFTLKGHKSILNRLKMEWNQFTEARKKLESMGLLRTFKDNIKQIITYVIYPTISFDKFCENQNYVSLLKNCIGLDQYDMLIQKHQPYLQKQNMVEISEDVGYLIKKMNVEECFIFDFSKLYQYLLGLFHDNVKLSSTVKKMIDDAHQYDNLNINELFECTKNSVVQINDKFLVSDKVLEQRLKEMVTNKKEQELYKLTKINRNYEVFFSDKPLVNYLIIINDYKKYKAENYLVAVLKQDITTEYQEIINTLRTKYNLADCMINAIIDFVIFKNNGNLVKNYIYKIASTISVKAFNKVDDLINYLRNGLVSKKTNIKIETNKTSKKSSEQPQKGFKLSDIF